MVVRGHQNVGTRDDVKTNVIIRIIIIDSYIIQKFNLSCQKLASSMSAMKLLCTWNWAS